MHAGLLSCAFFFLPASTVVALLKLCWESYTSNVCLLNTYLMEVTSNLCSWGSNWLLSSNTKRFRGVTLYLSRDGHIHLTDFCTRNKFLKKIRSCERLSCEIEDLSIPAAVKYNYFTFHHSVSWHHHCNSCLQVIVCKLQRDEFLASPRVTSIHTIGNPYQACLQHLAGKVKLSSDIRDLTQEEGWKTQDGIMMKECCERPECTVLCIIFTAFCSLESSSRPVA